MADIISTEIPRDIRKHKTTVVGPFSIRQALLIALAVVVDIGILMFVKDYISFDNCRPLIWAYIFIDIPILAFSFEPQGVPMEKYLKHMIYYNILLPAKRKTTASVREPKKYDIDKREEKARAKKIASLIHSHPEYKSYL